MVFWGGIGIGVGLRYGLAVRGSLGVTFYYNIKIFLGQGRRNEGRRVGTGVGGVGVGSEVVGNDVGDGVGGNGRAEKVWGFWESGRIDGMALNRAKNAVWSIL